MTPHKNCVSLKNTIADDKKKLIPMQNATIQIIENGRRSSAGVIRVPVINMTKKSGIMEIRKLTPEESTLDTGKIYFGIYTFVIKDAFPTIDIKPMLVASEKKLKKTIPVNRYTGKLTILDLNRVEKTTYCTNIDNSGFKKLQNTPRTDRLYFVLKSLETS
jgi:hypothetical protein